MSNADVDGVDDEWPPADPLDGVDDAWPPPPPPDPWDDVDDDNPPPRRKRHRYLSPTFTEVVASAEIPHTGPHRQRPAKPSRLAKKHAQDKARRQAKRLKRKKEHGHVPAASTIREHVQPTAPFATNFDTTSLPAALGAYAAKAKDADNKYGSKVRRSLHNILGLGFHLVQWNG